MTDDKKGLGRRAFLKGAGVAAVGAAAVAPLDVAQGKENTQEREKARYQETEHVKRFYKFNRV